VSGKGMHAYLQHGTSVSWHTKHLFSSEPVPAGNACIAVSHMHCCIYVAKHLLKNNVNAVNSLTQYPRQ